MKFPRLVYKSADVHKLVKSEDEFIEGLASGYYATVPEAIIGQHDADYIKTEPTIIEEIAEPIQEPTEEVVDLTEEIIEPVEEVEIIVLPISETIVKREIKPAVKKARKSSKKKR